MATFPATQVAFTESNQGLARLSTTILDATISTAQVLCTVPAGARVLPTDLVLRDNTFAYTGNTGSSMTVTFSTQSSGAVPIVYSNASAQLQSATGVMTLVAATASDSLAANAGAFQAAVRGQASSGGTAAAGAPVLNQFDTIYATVSFSAATPAPGSTIKCDVLGFIL